MAALPQPVSHTVAAIDAAYVKTARTGDSMGVPMSGVAEECSRKLWYAPVFAREQAEAAKADRGIWGSPCDATPGRPLRAGT